MEQKLICSNESLFQEIRAYCGKDRAFKILENAPTVFSIPENPTNGDMIKALFPSIEFKQEGLVIAVKGLDRDKKALLGERCFWADWWNAPYKGANNG